MSTKKELKEQYKQMKPDMGVFVFTCFPTGKSYLGFGQNVKADINSISFRLNIGCYNKNSHLQNDWKTHGEKNFEVKIVELLPYDRDETKKDYTDDLRLLREFCAERFPDHEFIQA